MNILYCNTHWDGNQLNTIIRQSINDELTDTWEINQYCKDNAPLVVAELEVDNIDVFNQIQLHSWINQDVTNDKRYLNYNLSINPYNSWK